jgi:hypothetical protein
MSIPDFFCDHGASDYAPLILNQEFEKGKLAGSQINSFALAFDRLCQKIEFYAPMHENGGLLPTVSPEE